MASFLAATYESVVIPVRYGISRCRSGNGITAETKVERRNKIKYRDNRMALVTNKV